MAMIEKIINAEDREALVVAAPYRVAGDRVVAQGQAVGDLDVGNRHQQGRERRVGDLDPGTGHELRLIRAVDRRHAPGQRQGITTGAPERTLWYILLYPTAGPARAAL